MSETTNSRVTDAIKPDGFVDFYGLLEQPANAPADALRARINTLYSEAQANRDHRNIAKRRDYEMMLELLPFARTVLLDDAKRTRYDSYAKEAQSGLANTDFETFMNELTGKSDSDAEERASLLGVQESGTARTTTTPARPAPRPAAKTPTAPARATSGGVSGSAKASLMGTVISVAAFFIVMLLVGLVMKNWPIAVGAGAIVGVVAWVVTHKSGGKIST